MDDLFTDIDVRDSPREAIAHYKRLLRETPLSNTLLRAIYQSSLGTAQCMTDASNAVPQFPSHIPTPPAHAPLLVKLLAHQAALLNTYHETAAIYVHRKQKGDAIPALLPGLWRAILKIRPVLQLLLREQDHNVDVSNSEDDSRALFDIGDDAKVLSTYLSCSPLSKDHDVNVVFVRKWIRAAGSVLDLYGSFCLLLKDYSKACHSFFACKQLRDIINCLRSPSTCAEMETNQDADKMEISSNDVVNVVEDGEKQPRIPDSDKSMDIDIEHSRSVYLYCIALVMDGQIHVAHSTITAVAEAICERPVQPESVYQVSNDVVYLAALILLQYKPTDHEALKQVGHFATFCLTNSYRIADCCSLLARCSGVFSTRRSMDYWEKMFAHCSNDIVFRPAAILLISRGFSYLGDITSQINALAVMRDEGESDANVEVLEGEGEDGFESAGKAGVSESVRLACPHGPFEMKEISKEDVALEEIGVMLAERKCKKANELKASVAQLIERSANIWILEENVGRARRGVELERDVLKKMSSDAKHGWVRKVGVLMSLTESAVRRNSASELAELYPVLNRHLSEFDSNGASSDGNMHMLNAMYIYNMGVVATCLEDIKTALEWYSIAQTKFEKLAGAERSDEVVVEQAKDMVKLVTLGKCLTLWFSGCRKEGAEHWVAKMGLEGKARGRLSEEVIRSVVEERLDEDDESINALITRVDDSMLLIMDDECTK